MAEAIVSFALEQLISVTAKKIEQEVRLVGNVKKEVKQLESHLRSIGAVLFDAEQKQVKDAAVRIWLDRLKNTSYDMEDVLDEWNTEIMKLQMKRGLGNAPLPKKKVCFFFSSPCFGVKQVVLRRDIALKIKEINGNLDVIAKEKDMYNLSVTEATEKSDRVQTTSLVDESEIYGRDHEKNTLVSKLLCETNEEQKGLHIISLVGMGGIGKTTLAQLANNNDEVIRKFETRIWVCVSDPFDEFKIAKAILEGLKCPTSNLVELESLMQCLHESIKDKKFLLILDDVWSEDYDKWKLFYRCLKNGHHGSKILITTRKETVALTMESTDILTINELSNEECWLLFRQLAFFRRSHEECVKLEEIGREIVGKCKGLPLAAKTIGSLLRFKRTRDEWQRILDSEIWKLEEIEKGLLSPLLLSYNDLPSIIRRCFSYCAIFPKDYNIDKDRLVKLWMAQGYLGLENNIEMEIIGQEYFDLLATRSFFQEFKRDEDGNIIECKMHDVVHDFAQFLSKNEYFTIEVNGAEELVMDTSHEKARHSMLMLKSGAVFPLSICNVKTLRSLLIGCEGYEHLLPSDVLPTLFGELTCLRVLDVNAGFIGANLIKEIPKEMGKLIHLRYLNLCGQNIEKLSETLCELYNLQILDVSWCGELKEFPEGMGKLINLRHLINLGTRSLRYMPKAIEKLTCLRTLSEFFVSDGGDGADSKACTLECLKDLNHLRGKLEIRGLGNVTNVSEVKRVEVLKNKKSLNRLELMFYKDGEGERLNENDELLLEALQPPPNLEKFDMQGYKGNTFPSNFVTSLTRLREIRLYDCMNCMHWSPLGKLPSLESLSIHGSKNVKRVVWGIQSDATSSSSSIILFPKLKTLDFWEMYEWEEWDYGNTIMPCLSSLSINRCIKLKALPDNLLQGTTLQHLQIFQSSTLEERYRKGTGENWPKISHIPNIKFTWSYLQGGPLH